MARVSVIVGSDYKQHFRGLAHGTLVFETTDPFLSIFPAARDTNILQPAERRSANHH
jgi:hypothetical protein